MVIVELMYFRAFKNAILIVRKSLLLKLKVKV